MLKKKIQNLVEKNNLDSENDFEIIYDSSAILIVGGGKCAVLEECGQFTGTCPSLKKCGTYTPPEDWSHIFNNILFQTFKIRCV